MIGEAMGATTIARRVPRGLTLLELMVVLVILAIVATVAVQSLQPQVDQQRFESASRLLTEIKSATVGPAQKYQLDGTPLISGFVADVGRCPQMENSPTQSADQSQILTELWDSESELGSKFPYQFRPGPDQPIDYSSIRLPCGWRGPYLNLPAGSDSLKDPWGRPPRSITRRRWRVLSAADHDSFGHEPDRIADNLYGAYNWKSRGNRQSLIGQSREHDDPNRFVGAGPGFFVDNALCAGR